MNRGLTISCIGHAAALLFAVVTISAQPMEVPATPTMSVDVISATDLSKLTQGVKNAPQLKIPDPKPLADKVGETKSIDQLAPNVADKPPITTDTKSKPTPDTKQADKAEKAKPAPTPDPKPADKPDKAKPTPDYKPDQIADILKKDAAKNPPPKPDDKPKPQDNTAKFDPSQVAALLDHRDPRRQMASAESINQNVTAGAPSARSLQLSQSEFDAFRNRMRDCFTAPAVIPDDQDVYIMLHISFRRDGTLAAEPNLVAGPPGSAASYATAMAETAVRALRTCQPFTMFRPEHYEEWKDFTAGFHSNDFRG